MTQAQKSFDSVSLLGDEHQGGSMALHASCGGSRDGQCREAIDEMFQKALLQKTKHLSKYVTLCRK